MRYQIRVQGHLDGDWSAWFDGLALSNLADGEMELAGELADQAALHGVLARARDLRLPLLAVSRVGSDGAAGDPEDDSRFARNLHTRGSATT